MRHRLPALLLCLSLAAACGGDETGKLATRVDAGDAGDAGGGAGNLTPSEAGVPGNLAATPAPAATATPEPQASGATPAPVVAAPAGTVNRPRTGTYRYALAGTYRNPFTANTDRPFRDGATQSDTVEDAGDGRLKTTTTTSEEQGGSQTTVVRWDPGGVFLESLTLSAGPMSFRCTFAPAVEILRLPLKAESYTSTGTGDSCSFTAETTVTGREDRKDATGKDWKTWRIEANVTYSVTSGSNSVDGTITGHGWLSPDLGAEIASVRDNDATFRSATGSSPIHSHTETSLLSHP